MGGGGKEVLPVTPYAEFTVGVLVFCKGGMDGRNPFRITLESCETITIVGIGRGIESFQGSLGSAGFRSSTV